MCATYYIAVDEREMAEIIKAVKKNSENQTVNTGNIYPKQTAPIFTRGENGIYGLPMFWGFPLKGKKSVNFNARSENITRIPMFRDSAPAVIPTSGFYEWRTEDDKRQKYIFNVTDERITYIAGLCSDFAYLNDGLYPLRFTMLTAPPTEEFKLYHDRQPVVLNKEECSLWLETKSKNLLFSKQPNLEIHAV